MPDLRLISIGILVTAASLATTAQACTVRKLPPPQALVADADSIYYVRAQGYLVPLEQRAPDQAPEVRFSLLSILKGHSPRQPLHYFGVLTSSDDPNDSPIPYVFVRPAGRHGMCFATEYKQGGEYLLFVKSGNVYWSPLAPTNEQVHGKEDRWLLWVKHQIALGK